MCLVQRALQSTQEYPCSKPYSWCCLFPNSGVLFQETGPTETQTGGGVLVESTGVRPERSLRPGVGPLRLL